MTKPSPPTMTLFVVELGYYRPGLGYLTKLNKGFYRKPTLCEALCEHYLTYSWQLCTIGVPALVLSRVSATGRAPGP